MDDWSLRSALCRYAQPEPNRVAAALSLVRRWEAAVHGYMPLLRRDGARYLAAAVNPATGVPSGPVAGPEPAGEAGTDPLLVGLLRVGLTIDRLGDVAAGWAVARRGDPSAEIDAAVARIATDLDQLGIPEEEPIPRGMRSRG